MVGVAVAGALLEPARLERHQSVVLAVGFALGLPHGAVDHLVPFWTGRLRLGPRTLLAVLVGYVTVAVATFALLRLVAVWTLPVLLLASVLHFGACDVSTGDGGPRRAPPLPPRSRWTSLLTLAEALARGGPVLVGPLLAWPERTQRALAILAPGLVLSGDGVRRGVLVVFAICVLITGVRTLSQRRLRPVLEVGTLTVLFVAAPPLVAFGIYFGGWHGLRHTARLLAADPRNTVDLAQGRRVRPVGRFLISAALPTLVAGGTVVGLIWLAGQQLSLVRPAFSILFALTVPHLVVVAVLDLTQQRRRTDGAAEPLPVTGPPLLSRP